MRFTPRFHALIQNLRLERRQVERANGVVDVVTPSGWTDARIEAWLDWADILPDDLPRLSEIKVSPSPVLGGTLDRWAARLAAWGRAMGVFDSAKDASAFAEDLAGSLILGLAAPSASRPDGARVHPVADDPQVEIPIPPVARLDDTMGRAAFDTETRRRQGEALAVGSLGRVCAALNAVANAVARCEGGASDCADPAANPALARAAWAARQAGAGDAAILRAISGEIFLSPTPRR